MAQAKAETVTLSKFRSLDSLSGHMRVEGGSRTRRGERRTNRRASRKSQKEIAGTDAANATAAGESAHTSAAHAASLEADAALANSQAGKAGASPTPKMEKQEKPVSVAPAKSGGGGASDGELIESLWEERSMLDGGEELPTDGAGFVDAVNDHIDLVRTTELLLRGNDEKSSKNLLEMLLEMKYGQNQRSAAAKLEAMPNIVPQAIRE